MPDENLPNPLFRVAEKDYRDYEFIFKDIEDFVKLTPQEQINRFRADPWSAFRGLKSVNGTELPLSRESHERFIQIATRGLKNLGMTAQDHRRDKVVEVLKNQLSSLIIQGFEITPANAHDVFLASISKLNGDYFELTYYVPCSVVAERGRTSFAIGPVTFMLREHFLNQNEPAIKHGLGDHKLFTEVMLSRTLAFYSDFQWIASIRVPRCDPEISRRRAHAGIQKALDVFKLVVGSQHASHVKQAYDLAAPSDFIELVSSSPGSFIVRSGGTLKDAVLNEQWYEQVSASPAWSFLVTVLFNYWNRWGTLDEIQTRFLDGLAWHSDAISEQDLGARIVKLWTAIERILSAAPGSNIPARTAALTSETPGEFIKSSRDLSILYQRRSDVVHGSANRANESWYMETAERSEQASKHALFQYLYAIPQSLLNLG